ncbi:hypothetical protein G6F57_013597 [Rhizopus arrhizus]|uniref:Uncharacterized protein n=1 Tax=Rhizopus oryzae TaxID=64495 RepID=A0A9P7BLA5_RHIOR|nr:hypothetical protein G6F23_011695 [Rhizopus arrhizus]KAG1396451.1 hypothetical protein G6F58_011733 [Rhizopus delemar]KAG0753813.1 hypothetical protein G6F24_012777 [Rhizopus arrhizus]KAG0778486.1 hypothetical protein G6F22_011207 [Rhizopus arrhizus]KAG0781036.1 hypothetical protein G6F21_011856 [Rhizopus arrhizus]
MSGSHTTPVIQQPTSDFAEYLLHERPKSILIAPYDLHSTLRIWLRNFEQQARIHGITNLDTCGVHLPRYLPTIIQQWMPTQPLEIVGQWSLLTKSLLARFGLPEEDNRRLLKDLRQTKKNPRESVKLHAAK